MEDRSGFPSQTYAYPLKLIYYYLNLFRNAVTYEDKLKKSINGMDESLLLTLPSVELRKIDIVSDIPCAPASNCFFLKSLHKLPKMLDGIPLAVTTLGAECDNCDEIKEFTFVRWSDFQYRLNSRLDAQKRGLYYTMKNIDSEAHLYVYCNSKYKDLKSVAVSAIFKNPLDVASFPKCGEEEKYICNPLDLEFIIEEELQPKVFAQVYEMLGKFKGLSQTADTLNNQNNDNAAKVPL